MNGKICVVTGASDGIGKATALGLAKMGATVVMVGRNRIRVEKALNEIKKKSRNEDVSSIIADLSSQASIRQLASDLGSNYSNLHILINNAGIIPKTRTLTEDGIETQFAVNHLGYFLLTVLLLDLLKASAPARIVNVSSGAHRNGSINFDDLSSEKSYDSSQVYSNTKLANVLFTYELTRRLGDSGVTVNCLHPGVIATKLLDHAMRTPRLLRFTTKIKHPGPEEGAKTSIYLASAPEVEGVTGKYFMDGKEAESSKTSHDVALGKKLWQASEELTGLLG